MTTTVKDRDQIADEFKWKLEHIYPGDDAWEEDFATLEGAVVSMASHKGKAAEGAEALHALLQAHDELEQLAQRVWWYVALRHDQDLRRNENDAHKQRVQLLLARANAETSWLKPEILAIGESTIGEWIDAHEPLQLYRFLLEDLFRQQAFVLDEGRETILNYSSPLGSAPTDAYTLLSTADVTWPQIELSTGERLTLTYSAYHHVLQTAREQKDRRRAFEALYSTFLANRNTYAALYSGVCQRDWFLARSRGYASTLEAALHGNDIPPSVVENLIRTTREGVAPLRRYYELRQRALGLESMHLYDGMVPLLDDDRHYSWSQSTRHVIDAVAPLGREYRERMERAFENGWVDVYENEGKRSGAYSAPVYGVHPYVLMNYRDTRSDLFTLAHEMGHSLHTELSHEHQPYVYASYTIFVAEVASTLNEAFLLDHLMERSEDPRERAMLLQHAVDTIVGTFFTQVLFADFELRAHQRVERGEPITADVLDDIYGGLMETYYGPSVTHDPQYRGTWCRIPHLFRSPYYVYQYATCFASSAKLHLEITQGDQSAATVDRYLELLSSGGNAHPMDQLRKAGVDLSRPEPVAAVIEQLTMRVDQLEHELSALGAI